MTTETIARKSTELVQSGETYTRRYIAHKPLTLCASCHESLTWTQGDFWYLSPDDNVECPICGNKIPIHELQR